MPTYYNRTDGPFAVTLRTGASTTVQRKSNLEVTAEEDCSPSIAYHLQKGHLVRVGLPVVEVSAVPEVAVAPVVVPEAAAVVLTVNKVSVPAEEPVVTETSAESAVLLKKKSKL